MSKGIDPTTMAAINAATMTVLNKTSEPTMEELAAMGYPKYHSIILWYLFGWLLFWIPCVYYLFSSNHGWKFGPIKFTPRKWRKYYKKLKEEEAAPKIKKRVEIVIEIKK